MTKPGVQVVTFCAAAKSKGDMLCLFEAMHIVKGVCMAGAMHIVQDASYEEPVLPLNDGIDGRRIAAWLLK